MTVKQVAEQLQVSTATVRRYLAMGLIDGAKDARGWWTVDVISLERFRRTYKGEIPPEERTA